MFSGRFSYALNDFQFENSKMQQNYSRDIKTLSVAKADHQASYERQQALFSKIPDMKSLVIAASAVLKSLEEIPFPGDQNYVQESTSEKQRRARLLNDMLAPCFLILASAVPRPVALLNMSLDDEKGTFRAMHTSASDDGLPSHYTCRFNRKMMKGYGLNPPALSFHPMLARVTYVFILEYRKALLQDANADPGFVFLPNGHQGTSSWLRSVFQRHIVTRLEPQHAKMTPHCIRHAQVSTDLLWSLPHGLTCVSSALHRIGHVRGHHRQRRRH